MHKDKRKNAFKSQQKVSLAALLIDLPSFIAVTALAVLSGSLMMMLDAFEVFSNILQNFSSFFLSKKLQGDDRFKYDYGMGKIESFGGLASAMLLFVGFIVVLIASVFSFINPTRPGEVLLFAIAVKVTNVAVDIWLLRKQLKTVRGVKGGFIDSNVILLKSNLVFDLIAFFTVTLSYLFRHVPLIVYLDPIMCVGCTVYFGAENIKIVKAAAADLLDKTLDEKTQMQILGCISKIWSDIDGFHGVRTRRSGHTVYIDLLVSFDGEKPYAAIYKAYETFDKAIKEIIPDSVSAVVLGEHG